MVGAFARAMLDGTRPVIHGDGLNERDYVHVDDVVQAHRLALRMRGDGTFNIATGKARTVRQVYESVARAAGYRGEPAYGEARRGDLRHCRLDVTVARRVLRWWPRVPFGRGIRRRSIRCARAPRPGRRRRPCDEPPYVPAPIPLAHGPAAHARHRTALGQMLACVRGSRGDSRP